MMQPASIGQTQPAATAAPKVAPADPAVWQAALTQAHAPAQNSAPLAAGQKDTKPVKLATPAGPGVADGTPAAAQSAVFAATAKTLLHQRKALVGVNRAGPPATPQDETRRDKVPGPAVVPAAVIAPAALLPAAQAVASGTAKDGGTDGVTGVAKDVATGVAKVGHQEDAAVQPVALPLAAAGAAFSMPGQPVDPAPPPLPAAPPADTAAPDHAAASASPQSANPQSASPQSASLSPVSFPPANPSLASPPVASLRPEGVMAAAVAATPAAPAPGSPAQRSVPPPSSTGHAAVPATPAAAALTGTAVAGSKTSSAGGALPLALKPVDTGSGILADKQTQAVMPLPATAPAAHDAAFQPPPIAQTAAPQPAVPPGVPSAVQPSATGLAAAVTAMHQSGQSGAVLRLDPPGLGTLSVHVALSGGGQVNVLFIPSTPAATAALQNNLSGLGPALAQSGLTLGQAQIGGQFNQNAGQGGYQPPASPGPAPAPAPARAEPAAPPTGVSAYA